MIKTTQEMLTDIVELKRLKGDMACFEINEQSCIFIEIFAYENKDTLNIAIEWRDSDTNEPFEATVCSYDDDREIESALDYIRRCALDDESENNKDFDKTYLK